MSKNIPKPWPRLTETLTGPKSPDACQACGANRSPGDLALTHWLECDDNDQKEPKLVVLCKPCADRLIEPHPRLYHQLSTHEPFPGGMELCLACKHRDGVRCTNPDAQINGGPGLKIKAPGSYAHVCRTPRRLSGWAYLGGPATECSGREERPV